MQPVEPLTVIPPIFHHFLGKKLISFDLVRAEENDAPYPLIRATFEDGSILGFQVDGQQLPIEIGIPDSKIEPGLHFVDTRTGVLEPELIQATRTP